MPILTQNVLIDVNSRTDVLFDVQSQRFEPHDSRTPKRQNLPHFGRDIRSISRLTLGSYE